MSAAHRRRHQVVDCPDDDDNDDQPTPKLSASAALSTETPAVRLRALLNRMPNNKPLLVPHPAPRSDVVDSDVDAADDDPRPPSPSASISVARESLRDIFMRARREPGDTPQKDKTPRLRRGSFDELDQQTRVRLSGKRKSLSDEELETLPGMSTSSIFRLFHNCRQVRHLHQDPRPCPSTIYAKDFIRNHKHNCRTSPYLHCTNVRILPLTFDLF
jgi:hypothetical protein